MKRLRWQFIVIGLLLSTQTALADTALRVFAAGSLRAVLTELGAGFEAREGIPVRFEFGPSGLLRDRLLKGEAADLFASANMEHPQALHDRGLAGPVRRFTRNSLCALVAPQLSVSPDTLLERMLDPSVKLATSVPKSDPAGDYAFELFARADKLRSGAGERLAAKALTLTGGPNSPPPPKDRSLYGKLVEEGAADIFLTYCTNALLAQRDVPAQKVVQIPPDLAVGADYGLTVLTGAAGAAGLFADFILSPAGQAVFEKQGFSPLVPGR